MIAGKLGRIDAGFPCRKIVPIALSSGQVSEGCDPILRICVRCVSELFFAKLCFCSEIWFKGHMQA